MKLIVFTRQDNIEVKFKTSLRNVENLSENFMISNVNLNTYLEQNLFYCFDKKNWTLNEMIFFAINNRMWIRIYDEANTLLKTFDCTSGVSITEILISSSYDGGAIQAHASSAVGSNLSVSVTMYWNNGATTNATLTILSGTTESDFTQLSAPSGVLYSVGSTVYAISPSLDSLNRYIFAYNPAPTTTTTTTAP